MAQAQNRRRLRNLLINPEQQIHYGTLFLAVSMCVHAVATGVVYALYMAWRDDVIQLSQMSLLTMIGGMLTVYVLLFAFSFVLGLMISHRLYGPLVAMDHHLTAVEAGDFSSKITLRKLDDEKLKEIAEKINRLTDRLSQATKK